MDSPISSLSPLETCTESSGTIKIFHTVITSSDPDQDLWGLFLKFMVPSGIKTNLPTLEGNKEQHQ